MRSFVRKQNQPQKPASSSLARANMATRGLNHREHSFLHLQRTIIGDQAVQRMSRTDAEELKAELNGTASPLFGHDFSRIPIHTPEAGAIQTRLLINNSDDKYEQEADRVAARVMNMPEALSPVTVISPSASVRPYSAVRPHGIEGVRSGSWFPQRVETDKIDSNTLTGITALIQRKPEAADKQNAQSSVREEYNKPELHFYNRMGLVDTVIPSPDPSEPTRSPQTPPQPEEGRSFEIGWTVRNIGWKTAPAHHNSLTIYDAKRCSGCRSPEDEVSRTKNSAPSLISVTQLGKEPGKDEYEESFIISGLQAGYYEIFAELDIDKEVDEINEDNNTQSMNLSVRSSNKPKLDTNEEEEETVQRKKDAGPAPHRGLGVESLVSGLRSAGQPLPQSLRDFFEPRFGYDFSRVRIHSDACAAESARKLHAKAFTVGRDVVFGEGQYAIEKREGRHLLAHELTHVVQQTEPTPFNGLSAGEAGASSAGEQLAKE